MFRKPDTKIHCVGIGGMGPILKRSMKGAEGLEHPVITDAGHFLQEDKGEELAQHVARFVRG